jgi:hypothetical protein
MTETWKRMTTKELFVELEIMELEIKRARTVDHRRSARVMADEITDELVRRNKVACGF